MSLTPIIPEFKDNRKITNPEFIEYINEVNTEICNKKGEGFTFGTDNAFAIIPKIDNHVYVYTILKYHGALHGEICLKIKLRENYSREATFENCKNQTDNFDPKLYWYQIYAPDKYEVRMIFNSTETLVDRLEKSDSPLQPGDLVYNFIPKYESIFSQYLVIERRVGSLIQQTILDNHSTIATLVKLNSIDPANEQCLALFFKYFLPCFCCFYDRQVDVFDQENQYEQIEHSE